MKQQTRIFIVALVVLIALVLAFLGVFQQKSGFNWAISFDSSSKEPYGASVLAKLLEGYIPNHQLRFLDNAPDSLSLNTAEPQAQTYFFLGDSHFQEPDEALALFRFVERGGQALIVSEEPSPWLLDTLLSGSGLNHKTALKAEWIYEVELELKENNSTTSIFYKIPEGIERRNYTHFNPLLSSAVPRVRVHAVDKKSRPVFIEIPHGDGRFLLHVQPLVFSNYHLLRPSVRRHAAAVLSFLPEADILWDRYSRVAHNFSPQENYTPQPGKSPLQFILNHEALRWSFYLMLCTALVYIGFTARRRQRIIPIREPLRNFSLNFIRSIGRLYFLERRHEGMVRHQMRYLLSFLRERYKLNLNEFGEEQAELIHHKTGADLEVILRLAREYQRIKVYALPEDSDALQFHAKLTQFYKSCK